MVDIIVITVLALIVTGIIRIIIKDKKNNKGCGGCCDKCSSGCHY